MILRRKRTRGQAREQEGWGSLRAVVCCSGSWLIETFAFLG